MTTPFEPAPQDSYATFAAVITPPASTSDPDNPPWGVGAAALAWLASVALLFTMQLLAVAPYIFYRYRQADFVKISEAITNDPNVIVVSIISVIPAHLLTLAVVWAFVTRVGKCPFWRTLGWAWSENFGFWASAGAALVLLLTSMAFAYFLGGEKTPFEQMIESSDAARLTTAFIAVAGAPLVEELIYRGMLYSALQRTIGVVWAVLVVTLLFTLVHVGQYHNNYAAIATVGTLSFFLTCVRAGTGRLLPCFIIHLIYNSVLVSALIYQFLSGK